MRALRDFNTPKIVSADTPIFLRLIADLFPSMDLAPKVSGFWPAAVNVSAGRLLHVLPDSQQLEKQHELSVNVSYRCSQGQLGQ